MYKEFIFKLDTSRNLLATLKLITFITFVLLDIFNKYLNIKRLI